MQIEVWKAYTGNRCNHVIDAGTYNEGDKRLFGLDRYLIDNGNAREVVTVDPFANMTEEQLETLENQARALTAANDITRAKNAPDTKSGRKAKS